MGAGQVAGNPGQKQCDGGDDVRKDSRRIAHERPGMKISKCLLQRGRFRVGHFQEASWLLLGPA